MSGIHPSSVIDPSAEIHPEAEIGPYCVVGPRVRVGARTRLLHRCSIIEGTVLGEDNVVYPGAVIGGDPQDKKFVGEETWLYIGNHNTLREGVTINRGTGLGGGETRIGNNCLIMAGVHVAHDCILGDRVTIANNVLLGGHTLVEDGVGFGGFSAVHHYVSIGCYSFVGGMTRVVKDAPPFMITEGQRAKVRAVNRVGLKRGGFSEETMAWLKEACRQLFHDENSPTEEVLERLRNDGHLTPEAEHFINFVSRSVNGKQGRQIQP